MKTRSTLRNIKRDNKHSSGSKGKQDAEPDTVKHSTTLVLFIICKQRSYHTEMIFPSLGFNHNPFQTKKMVHKVTSLRKTPYELK